MRKRICVLVWALVMVNFLDAQNTIIEKWKRFEATLDGPSGGNPYTDVTLTATFSNGNKAITVAGFYDGNGKYKIRFMPADLGTWKYVTASNHKQLSNRKGELQCVIPTGDNHGPVRFGTCTTFNMPMAKTIIRLALRCMH